MSLIMKNNNLFYIINALLVIVVGVIALFIPAIGIQLFWIIQAGVIGAFLISGLLIVVSYSKNK